MKALLSAVLLSLAAALPASAAGIQRIEVPLPGGPAMRGAVWYPSDAPTAELRLGPFAVQAAPGAPFRKGRHPLVVISHGTAGGFIGHYDLATALADAGFIVAAVTHPGDNVEEQSGFIGQRRFLDRPTHIAALVAHLTGPWTEAGRVDAGRIGLFGFSTGGYTALVAAGGVPDFSRLPAHCRAHDMDPICGMLMPQWSALEAAEGKAPTVSAKAIVVAAPGPGVLFDRDALSSVQVPVRLWRGEKDELLLQPFHADHIAEALGGRAMLTVVPNAGHYAFLPPCDEALARAVPEICTDPPGFDRAALHDRMNAATVRFFTETLRP